MKQNCKQTVVVKLSINIQRTNTNKGTIIKGTVENQYSLCENQLPLIRDKPKCTKIDYEVENGLARELDS